MIGKGIFFFDKWELDLSMLEFQMGSINLKVSVKIIGERNKNFNSKV